MITKIENIRNEFLFKQYKDMVDSMYEEIGSAKWGVRTRIKTKKISLIDYRTFNFFGMYHKEIYKLYLEVYTELKKEKQIFWKWKEQEEERINNLVQYNETTKQNLKEEEKRLKVLLYKILEYDYLNYCPFYWN